LAPNVGHRFRAKRDGVLSQVSNRMEIKSKMRNNRVDEGKSEMLEHVGEEETRLEESGWPCGQREQFGEETEREDASPNAAGPRQGNVSQNEEKTGIRKQRSLI
jgi:hypothetical protein